MKILQLIQKKQMRGAEIFATQLSSHLLKKGHFVEIVALTEGNSDLIFEKPIFSLDVNLQMKMFDIRSWRKLAVMIQQQRPDIVQANAADTLKYAVLSKILFRWKQPIIYRNASMMSHYSSGRLSRILNSFFLKHVSHVISVSNSAKEDLCSFFGVSRNKVTVVPIGLEKKEYLKIDLFDKNSPNLIHVGGFSFEKNHTGLLRIFKEVLNNIPTAKLWLLGDGRLKNEIRELALRMDIADYVFFTGVVSNPLDYIHSSDILLLPSLLEGLPAVILEAFYCKTPVIAYDVGGIKEILTDKTGWLISKDNESEFAIAILQILDRQGSDKKQEAAWAMVNNRFLNNNITTEFEKCYSDLLKQ